MIQKTEIGSVWRLGIYVYVRTIHTEYELVDASLSTSFVFKLVACWSQRGGVVGPSLKNQGRYHGV